MQWSVCAWAPDGSLVVSLWAHHYRKGPENTAEYADRTERWSGPGKNEFQENVAKAFAERSTVRLIVVRTLHPERVQAGESANKISKDFDAKTEQIVNFRSSTATTKCFGSAAAPTRAPRSESRLPRPMTADPRYYLIARLADAYAFHRPPIHAAVWSRVAAASSIEEPMTDALDVGCGAGASSAALVAYAREVTGVDPSEAMLRRARQALPNTSFVLGRSDALPLADAT